MLKRRRHNYSFCFVLFLFCTELFVLFIAFFLLQKKYKKFNYRLKQTILQTSTSSMYKKTYPFTCLAPIYKHNIFYRFSSHWRENFLHPFCSCPTFCYLFFPTDIPLTLLYRSYLYTKFAFSM